MKLTINKKCYHRYQVICSHFKIDGTVFAWGCNRYGQLGINNNEPSTEPQQILKLSAFYIVQIAAGGSHSLAVTNSGALFSWGKNRLRIS